MEIEKDISGASEQKTDEIKNAMSDVDISNEDNPKGDGFENQVSYRGNEERGEGTEYASNEANETPEETSSSEGGQLVSSSESAGKDSADKTPEENDAEHPADGKAFQELKSEQNLETETEEQAHAEKEEDDDHEDEDQQVDYSNYSKKQLVEVLAALTKEDNINKIERVLKEVKPHYDELRNAEREKALEKFIAEGGDEADFAYKPDELDIKFDADYGLLKERRSKHFASIEKQKDDNLAAKNQLLEQLRKLVDDEETTASLDELKKIQSDWKKIGQVPAGQVKTLWANYNALLDRFYDNRSIYFELKELDRKKNLEAKLELCERAEKLQEETNLKNAIKELNELHEEFRHIGPVPQEDQEALWQRFKAASDALYDRRREFIDKLKGELHENMIAKKALGDEVQTFLTFDSDRINEWNEKTKEILELQKKWEAIGGLPKDKAKAINKHFWGGFKGFFANKNAFFKKLEGQREENLKKKEALVQQAEELKDSQDWDKTAEALKKLQAEWRTIGPVPEKFRNSIFAQFKKACDHFFEQKRAKNKEANKEFEENLAKKKAICEAIEKLAEEKSSDVDKLEVLFDEYQGIGFVPRSAIKSIQNRFNDAVNKFLEGAEELGEEQKHNIKLTIKFSKLKNSPNANRKLHQKEGEIRKHISNLENDIVLWKNNLEFFANSKTADKLKEDFDIKIKKAKEELEELREQLHVIRNI